MEKNGIFLLVLLFSIVIAAHTIKEDPESVHKWFKNLPHRKEKLTKLHFYFHDIITSKNPTAVQVAQANTTSKSQTKFGSVFVIDDLLTKTSDPNSKIVGRAQGIYTSVSQQEISLLMTLNFVFTAGKYNGSSLSVLGHNPIFHKYRELPIIGGSGIFRLARGIATAKTYSLHNTNFNAVVEYHVVVLHY